MSKFYSSERSVLILIALLKAHNIKRIIASPGTTNLTFVASLQSDSFFEIFSCVDERSAAYMACGMAAETGEPVVITCTGATASRNYPSALTEAYYRKLPILAITGTQDEEKIGHLHAQIIDRSVLPKDTVRRSFHIKETCSDKDAYFTELKINQAINELYRHGGGPVHINLETTYNRDFSVKNLPSVRIIKCWGYKDVDKFPPLINGRIGICIGSHHTFKSELTDAIDNFCAAHDAVCFCDNTSGYYGKFRINYALLGSQEQREYSNINVLDLCIHIGEITADYATVGGLVRKNVWRVSEDGEIRDQFRKVTNVFEMAEEDFFRYYTPVEFVPKTDYLNQCKELDKKLRSILPDIGFSNIWIASQIHDKLPIDSEIHFGVLNSVRSWNLFNLPPSVQSFANVGGFGIDGGVSSLVGASLINPNKLYFGVVGDLAFFYDMNSIGNRHIGNNLRILVVNNGRGQEFRNHYHAGSMFGNEADKYIAAAGHFGNQSRSLLKSYAESLGFSYLSAATKEEFHINVPTFLNPNIGANPILFECFTETQDEADAMKLYWNVDSDLKKSLIHTITKAVGGQQSLKKILGPSGVKFFKKILKK